jgi:hypothetical protein
MQSKSKKHMKKYIPILGITGLALSALSAHAQNVFTYSSGDVILDFSQTGSSDFEVDLGSLAGLQAEAAAGAGTVVLTGAANGFTLAQLSGNFANYNNLSLAIFGTTGSGGSDYFTKKRNNPLVQNATPNDITRSTANSGASDVLGVVGVGSSHGILEYSGTTTANVAEILPSNGNSYTTLGNTALNGIANVNSIKNTTGASFSGSIVSDLFEYNGLGSSTPAVFEGDFTFNSNGTLDFSEPVAAPESASYGLLAGGGLLLLSLRRQFRRQQA